MQDFNLQEAKRMLNMGFSMVHAYRDLLDRINVFPVPDGDTGKNLDETGISVMDQIGTCGSDTSYEKFRELVKHGVIVGSKGNSGTIFARWLIGVIDSLDFSQSDPDWIKALSVGCSEAHESVSQPRPGTMLTVMSDLISIMKTFGPSDQDSILDGLFRSVDSTTDLMPLLRENNVVDSGALGIALFVEGVFKAKIGDDSLKSRYTRFNEFIPTVKTEKHRHKNVSKYRYCTQVVFRATNASIDYDREISFLRSHSDSEILIGAADVYKVHVHTNSPKRIVKHFSKIDNEAQFDIDDMWEQSKEREKNLTEKQEVKDESVIIITDVTSDLSLAEAKAYGVEIIGMMMGVGETKFFHESGWQNLSPEDFYGLLKKEGASSFYSSASSEYDWIKTAKPYLEKGSDVIFITMSANVSSTFSHAKMASAELQNKFPGQNIVCIDSKTTAAGLGYLVKEARKALRSGLSIQKVEEKIKDLSGRIHVFIVVDDIEYLLHSGRISDKEFRVAKFFGRRPVLTFDKEGRVAQIKYVANSKNFLAIASSKLYKGTIAKGESFSALSHLAMRSLDGKPLAESIISVIYTDGRPQAEKFIRYLKHRHLLNKLNFDLAQIGPVIGGHIGPGKGNVGIFLLGKPKK